MEESILDTLLGANLPNLKKAMPMATYEIERLSALASQPILFTIKGISYDDIQRIRESVSGDAAPHIVLSGVVEPDLKNTALKERFSEPTSVDMLTALLLPGEIEDVARAIETLSGYRRMTIREVKND